PAVLSSRGDVVEMQVRHVGFLPFAGDPAPLLAAVVSSSKGTARPDGYTVVLVNKADAEESGQGHDVLVAALLDQRVEQTLVLRVPGLTAIASLAAFAVLTHHPSLLILDALD